MLYPPAPLLGAGAPLAGAAGPLAGAAGGPLLGAVDGGP
jgi:hypothetical protein